MTYAELSLIVDPHISQWGGTCSAKGQSWKGAQLSWPNNTPALPGAERKNSSVLEP